ncbi:MAG: hypothetical protein ACNI27_05600 [Desulfovibrio sp.]
MFRWLISIVLVVCAMWSVTLAYTTWQELIAQRAQIAAMESLNTRLSKQVENTRKYIADATDWNERWQEIEAHGLNASRWSQYGLTVSQAMTMKEFSTILQTLSNSDVRKSRSWFLPESIKVSQGTVGADSFNVQVVGTFYSGR